MWTCPRCKHRFVNRNQSHSCGAYTVEDFTVGKTTEAVGLFKFFLRRYRTIGPFRLDPVRTRVALLTKVRFCAVNRIGEDYIDVLFVLTEPHRVGPIVRRIENLGDRFFIHHVRILRKSDINHDVEKLMKLAYRVGKRAHIAKMRN